jgi:hypothetical protein
MTTARTTLRRPSLLSATGLMVLGHVLMLFAIAAAMSRRRGEYT